MNQLERAATALVDRPPAPPAPLEQIERRAAALRRRRRLLEAGAIGLVVLLLGTAGLVVSSVRGGDDQGVFVGEGPSTSSVPTTAVYQLAAPVDDATAEALKQAVEARFRWFGAGDADVHVDGTRLMVTTAAPADRIDGLVTTPGGFELRVIVGEADPAACDSNGGGRPGTFMTSALAGPPRCLETTPGPTLPSPPAFESGSMWINADRYEVTLGLTAAASQAVIDHWPTCVKPCLPDSVAVVSGEAILHPAARLTSTEQDGHARLQVDIPGFADPADAQMWASVLVHPLPPGMVFN